MVRWRGKVRSAWGGFSVLCGLASAYYIQPIVHNNSDASNLIVTVFTVFAGVSMALITAIGDPSLMPSGSWRAAENSREAINRQLIRQATLFCLYLFVILIFLTCYITKGAHQTPFLDRIVKRLEEAYLFFSTATFIVSLSLPLTMLKLQQRRLDLEIRKRQREAGIRSPLI